MLSNTKKYIINLKKRPNRLEHIIKEMNYMEFNFEVFEGIERDSHEGCALSHIEIIKKAKEQNLDKVIVMEDDIFFMPYAKSLLADLENILKTIDYKVLNLNMSIHRPLNISSISNLLLDLTHLPPKDESIHRGIFGTGFMVYTKDMYDEIYKYNPLYAIDEFLSEHIYPKYQSYSTILPLCCQLNNQSDVSGGFYNNFLTQSYNWNVYTPIKLPTSYMEQDNVIKIRNNNDINYKSILNEN
jgi:GR25 family glycosyltransferase involved in LPS biosynthesis